MAIDMGIQAALGRFFAARFRAGVLYSRFTNGPAIARRSKRHSRRIAGAREIWAKMAEDARAAYMWTMSRWANWRGCEDIGLDRLPAIDADIANMAKRLESPAAPTTLAP